MKKVAVVQVAQGFHVVPGVARSCRLEVWGADSTRVTIETTLNGTDVGLLISAFTDKLDVMCLAGPLRTVPCSDGSSMTPKSTLVIQDRELVIGVLSQIGFVFTDTLRSIFVNVLREISEAKL